MIYRLIRIHKKKIILFSLFVGCLLLLSMSPIHAEGDVAGAIEDTWKSAQSQIKTVVNNVIFPAIDMILAIFFFVKLGTSYFDYKRNNNNFEWQTPAILFVCLVFTLTAPLYIWRILS